MSLRLLPTGKTRGFRGDIGARKGGCYGDDFYFSTFSPAIATGRATRGEFPVSLADDETDYGTAAPRRPHLYITACKGKGLLSVTELREGIKTGHRRTLWEALKKRADADLRTNPVIAHKDRKFNANYIVCNDTAQRILRAALGFLLTGDPRFKHAALRQIEVTFDTTQWPTD